MLTDDQTVLYQLAFARQKLFAPDIPLCLKAISYVRICCSAIKKLDYFPGVLTLNPLAHKTSCKICVSSFGGKTAETAVFPQVKIT